MCTLAGNLKTARVRDVRFFVMEKYFIGKILIKEAKKQWHLGEKCS